MHIISRKRWCKLLFYDGGNKIFFQTLRGKPGVCQNLLKVCLMQLTQFNLIGNIYKAGICSRIHKVPNEIFF